MGISIWQIAIIVLIVVLLFGAGKIPRLMGDVAKGINSFKKGLKEDGTPASEDDKLANEQASEEPAKKDETAKTGS